MSMWGSWSFDCIYIRAELLEFNISWHSTLYGQTRTVRIQRELGLIIITNISQLTQSFFQFRSRLACGQVVLTSSSLQQTQGDINATVNIKSKLHNVNAKEMLWHLQIHTYILLQIMLDFCRHAFRVTIANLHKNFFNFTSGIVFVCRTSAG